MNQLCVVGLIVSCFFATIARSEGPGAASAKYWVFVGTYTNPKSKGIYRLELDAATGKLSDLHLAAETPSPSFVAIHPNGQFLYAVGEMGSKTAGSVAAFALERKTGALKLLNRQSSLGGAPCHINVDKTGKNVLIANYVGGSAAVLPIQAGGKLGEASSFVQHKGSSVNKSRQEAPHAHSINLDKNNRFAFVADLGLDKVLIYRFDAAKGTITPNEPDAATVDPGAGPRHFAFHPNGKYAYVINEMGMTVTAFDYDSDKGVLKNRQTIGTLPAGVKGGYLSTAEVVVHPSGKFLYGSNRGHNSIAIFSIDEKSGDLKAVGHQGHKIKLPRNFAIEPTGRFLRVANQRSDSILSFRVDGESGRLTPTGEKVEVASPVCIRFR